MNYAVHSVDIKISHIAHSFEGAQGVVSPCFKHIMNGRIEKIPHPP